MSPRFRSLISRCLAGGLLGGLIVCVPTSTFGDVIRLKNGGEVRGLISKTSAPQDSAIVIRTVGGAEVTIDRQEIDFISTRSPLVEEYYSRARRIPDTVESHWELAAWCLQRQMPTQRREELERIVELDPNHDDARKSLGHIRHRGEWMAKDEAMARQGYVKYKGRFVTEHEFDLLEKTAAERSAEADWHPKVRRWVNMLTDRDPIRRSEGELALRSIADPDAVSGLNQFLASHENPLGRKMFVDIVSRMPGKKPVRRLVDRILLDSEPAVRDAALAGIATDQAEEAVRYLLPGLKHKDNAVVRRAAVGVGKFGDQRTVPNLIAALISSHRVRVQVPSANAMGFANTPNGVRQFNPNNGYGGSSPSQIEGLALTGQLPYGAVVLREPNEIIHTTTVSVDVRNEEVLVALRKITGKDFGYDQRGWQRWHAANDDTRG